MNNNVYLFNCVFRKCFSSFFIKKEDESTVEEDDANDGKKEDDSPVKEGDGNDGKKDDESPVEEGDGKDDKELD